MEIKIYDSSVELLEDFEGLFEPRPPFEAPLTACFLKEQPLNRFKFSKDFETFWHGNENM
jgi:hypothetical protein